MDKHKVFISYYHGYEQKFAEKMMDFGKKEEIFEDAYVNNDDIEYGLSSEDVRNLIRDKYIKDATVLILLCGVNTKKRKYIDWELQAAMFNDKANPKLGILVINLPESKNKICKASVHEGKLIKAGVKQFPTTRTREECEYYYPNLPDRLIDNLYRAHVNLTVVDWNVAFNKEVLMDLVDGAHKRRQAQNYDYKKALKKYND